MINADNHHRFLEPFANEPELCFAYSGFDSKSTKSAVELYLAIEVLRKKQPVEFVGVQDLDQKPAGLFTIHSDIQKPSWATIYGGRFPSSLQTCPIEINLDQMFFAHGFERLEYRSSQFSGYQCRCLPADRFRMEGWSKHPQELPNNFAVFSAVVSGSASREENVTQQSIRSFPEFGHSDIAFE